MRSLTVFDWNHINVSATSVVYCLRNFKSKLDKYNFGRISTVYPKKYAHGFVVLCFVVDMQSFIMNPHEIFIHIHQGCFAGTGAIVRLPQCQWSKPDGYGKISQCITTRKHSKAKTVCIFFGIYCMWLSQCQPRSPDEAGYIVHWIHQWLSAYPLPIAAYMRQWIGPAMVQTMVQTMACHLFGAKPLSEPMGYCQSVL